jgi:predicted Rossmann-fold nucleotide-binding protein
VVLFDSAYWKGLLGWIRDPLLAQKMISPDDLELLVVTNEPAEAVETVVAGYERRLANTLPSAPAKADAQ